MPNIRLIKSGPFELGQLKQEYLDQLVAPIDGMWESFVRQGFHHVIEVDNQDYGYVVVNGEQRMLQFYLLDGQDPQTIFRQCIDELEIKGAFAATCEGLYLALCMDHQNSIEVNAMMYVALPISGLQDPGFPASMGFRKIESADFETAVAFGVDAIDANRQWLEGYYAERIERGELFCVWQEGQIIAAGECRTSSTQKPFADLGMVVARDHRGKGLATTILRQLLLLCESRSLRAICSTERGNMAARKAIEKAGFRCYHRVLDIRFCD